MFFCTSGHHRRRLWRHDFHFQSRPLTGVDVVDVPGHFGCSLGKPLTGVDVVDAVYVVVVNFVAPLTLMAFFYSRISRYSRIVGLVSAKQPATRRVVLTREPSG